MQLKRLSLENFRNYKGNRDIIFSTDKDHNVTIVIAENGAGKTTLTQAFQWCLYGTTEFADKGMFFFHCQSLLPSHFHVSQSRFQKPFSY